MTILPDRGEHPIDISSQRLLEQAVTTADHYMFHAKQLVDERFGKGYATKHPELVVAFMYTAAADYGAGILAQQLRAGLDNIAVQLADIGEQMHTIANAIDMVSEKMPDGPPRD
jgi:hypothetical protein